MQTKVQHFIAEHKLFQKEDRLLLAVSGGMDSMVMAHLLLESGYSIGLVHCNFQLRGEESEADEQMVKSWAEEQAVPFYSKSFNTKVYAGKHKLSTQMAARDLRYSFFEEIRIKEGFDYILTAHHLDDRLETFWLNFSRGAGWKGLTALRASKGAIRRPLLCVNREQIANYQKTEAVPYREDASNATDVYRRNAFRHKVLPSLYEWDPQIADRMTSNFSHLEQMYSIYKEAVKKELDELSLPGEDGFVFQRLILLQHPASETLMWELLSPYGFSAEDCRQALVAKSGTILSAGQWQLLVQEEQLLLREARPNTDEEFYRWEEGEAFLLLHSGESLHKSKTDRPENLPVSTHIAVISQQNLVYPLNVRHWQAGDSFCPLGMKGKHQKLQDFFTNNKIDRFQRQSQWLLINGDGQIIWIIGQRLDDRFKVSDQDIEVLKIECLSV